MEARNGKVWHKFAEDKPTENGFYAAITDKGYISTLLYFTESGLFNWRGEGDDTHIEVEYWAELQDIVESARLHGINKGEKDESLHYSRYGEF